MLHGVVVMNSVGLAGSSGGAEVVARVESWLKDCVIGMGLCPFAAQPSARGAVRVVVCTAIDELGVLEQLQAELERLADVADGTETSLLVIPELFADFTDFNDFLDPVDGLIEHLGWEGEFQVASFHPRYQFADSADEDPGNFTNRAPYPILHVLREASIEAALQHFDGDPQQIPERNIAMLQALSVAELQLRFPWSFDARR